MNFNLSLFSEDGQSGLIDLDALWEDEPMSKVKLGPFSRIHVSILKQKLEKDGILFETEEDPDLLRQFAQNARRREPTNYPTYSGAAEYIYIEIEKEHLLRIKKDLDQMGFALVDSEPPEGEDYYCPSCDYASPEPGICPRHGLQLLDFSGWAERKSVDWKTLRMRAFFWIALALSVAIFGYGIWFFVRDHFFL